MIFETKNDVLNWYQKQPRTLTKEFVDSINWKDVKNYPLDARFIPVILYMRDIETLTDVYFEELYRTPTGKDPDILKFMEQWSVEERTHGEVLNRFLNEAGIETDKDWQAGVKNALTRSYKNINYVTSVLATLIGKRFTATHMAFGAIHEMSTTQAYRRLKKLANHPVLSEILTAIVREESAHATFYRQVAKIELRKSEYTQKIARFFVKHFWEPVGTGAQGTSKANYMIATLFEGVEGLDWIDRNVTQRIQRLPGFAGLTNVSERIEQIALAGR